MKAPVAGIAMGLVSDDVEVDGKTERRFVTLTDILGAEDAFGDMDFKVAGTKDFVTALQLDTKLDGIPSQVLAGALAQAKDARLTILEVMAEAIDTPDEMSPYAPRVTTIKVPVDKIGEVIGPRARSSTRSPRRPRANLHRGRWHRVRRRHRRASAQAAIDKINAIANPQLPTVGERFLGTVVRRPTSVPLWRCCPVAMAWCTSPSWQGQAHRQGRGRRQCRRQAAGGDRRHRQARQDLAGVGGRGRRFSRCGGRDSRHRPMPPRQAADPAAVRHCAAPHCRRSAGRHRIPACGALRVGRGLGRGRVAGRGTTVAGAAHFLEHLLFKSTPTAPRWTSLRRWTPSVGSSTRSPPRSTPATTRTCSTTT
ncbi:insulinase family protein [Mycobacterium ulcerans str. Harvey]|uniref:Insulinase family protein n=1 Tax=Mycobacterium ulcerans str. Harvey TaxID=1299332 RepID=A0ABP3ABD0_MYCUL|nr:insulinase family protein [Mycobacterium ulcerans str. Harvey]